MFNRCVLTDGGRVIFVGGYDASIHGEINVLDLEEGNWVIQHKPVALDVSSGQQDRNQMPDRVAETFIAWSSGSCWSHAASRVPSRRLDQRHRGSSAGSRHHSLHWGTTALCWRPCSSGSYLRYTVPAGCPVHGNPGVAAAVCHRTPSPGPEP